MRATGGRGGGGRRARAGARRSGDRVGGGGLWEREEQRLHHTGYAADQARSQWGCPYSAAGTCSACLKWSRSHPTRPSASNPCSSPSRSRSSPNGIRTARELLGERTVWNVSSTAKGGGVVELLLPLIGYAKGAGVDARWAVIEGNPEFFKVTKRIHNLLHGFEGDGGDLDDEARKVYEGALEPNAARARGARRRRRRRAAPRPADRRADRPAQAHRRQGDLALPHRHRRAERHRAPRVGLPARRRRAGRRLRLLARGVRVGGPRRRQGRDHRAVDRRLQRQEPGARGGAGARDPGRRRDRRRRRRRADLPARRRQRGARVEPGPDLRGRAPHARGPASSSRSRAGTT